MQIVIRSNQVTLSGYVTATARDSKLLPPRMTGADCDSFEQIVPGTFARAIQKNQDIKWMFNHERVIGELGKNLELSEDAVGLKVRAVTDDPEVLAAARAGALTGWSWGMRILHEQPPDEVREGVIRRYVDEIELSEVSLLTMEPASVATTVETDMLTRAMEDSTDIVPDYGARIKMIENEKERMRI